jgi:hypothetical protein
VSPNGFGQQDEEGANDAKEKKGLGAWRRAPADDMLGVFLGAADSVVQRWGPTWARRMLLGRSVGAWLLLLVWATVPFVVVAAIWMTRGGIPDSLLRVR